MRMQPITVVNSQLSKTSQYSPVLNNYKLIVTVLSYHEPDDSIILHRQVPADSHPWCISLICSLHRQLISFSTEQFRGLHLRERNNGTWTLNAKKSHRSRSDTIQPCRATFVEGIFLVGAKRRRDTWWLNSADRASEKKWLSGWTHICWGLCCSH